MTPDIVTEARRFLGAWGDDVYPSQLVTELVAEVERLRHELDQRTDPERCVRCHGEGGWTNHGQGFWEPCDCDAARLLGGDQ